MNLDLAWKNSLYLPLNRLLGTWKYTPSVYFHVPKRQVKVSSLNTQQYKHDGFGGQGGNSQDLALSPYQVFLKTSHILRC